MTANATPILQLDHVGKRFGGLQAVHDLSFVMREGEILGLIGPNGAGKSTLFNLINGVFAPNTGRIVFAGIDISGQAPYLVARHGLARTHQIVQPLTNMTVLENCTVGACFGRENLPLGRAREVAREAAIAVGLEDRLEMLALHLTIAGKKRLVQRSDNPQTLSSRSPADELRQHERQLVSGVYDYQVPGRCGSRSG